MFKRKSKIQGSLDGFVGGYLKGWVFDASRPGHRVEYFIEVDGNVVFSGQAAQFRPDLLSAEIDDGGHGFSAYLWQNLGSGNRFGLLDDSLNLIAEEIFKPEKSDILCQLVDRSRFTLEFEFTGLPSGEDGEVQLFCQGGLVSMQLLDNVDAHGSCRLNIGVPRILFDGIPKLLMLVVAGVNHPLWTGSLVFEAYERSWPQNALSQLELQSYTALPESHYRYLALGAALEESSVSNTRLTAIHDAHRRLFSNNFDVDPKTVIPMPEINNKDVDVTVLIHSNSNTADVCKTLCSLVLSRSDLNFQVTLVEWPEAVDERVYTAFPGTKKIGSKRGAGFAALVNSLSTQIDTRWVACLEAGSEVTNGWLDSLVESLGIFTEGRVAAARPVDKFSGFSIDASTQLLTERLTSGYATQLHPGLIVFEKSYFPQAIEAIQETGNIVAGVIKTVIKNADPVVNVGTSEFFPSNQDDAQVLKLAEVAQRSNTLLVIDYDTPQLNVDAGSYAAIQEIKILQSLGYSIRFLPLLLSYQGQCTKELMKLGVEVLIYPHFASVEQAIESAYDDGLVGVYITRYSVAEAVLPVLKRIDANLPVLLNNADLHFLREMRAAIAKDDSTALIMAEETRSRELSVYKEVDGILCYTEIEQAVISSHLLETNKIFRGPWVIEKYKGTKPSFGDRSGLAFLGGFAHEPNMLAFKYFASEIMPELVKANKNTRLFVYGSNAPDELWEFASKNIQIVGYVDDLADVFLQHRVFVAPLTSGAGLKGKVVEAMAWGLPCVLSKFAAEGTGLLHQESTFIAENVESWVEYIGTLYNDEKVWSQMAQKQIEIIERDYSFEKGSAMLREALEYVGIEAAKGSGKH